MLKEKLNNEKEKEPLSYEDRRSLWLKMPKKQRCELINTCFDALVLIEGDSIERAIEKLVETLGTDHSEVCKSLKQGNGFRG